MLFRSENSLVCHSHESGNPVFSMGYVTLWIPVFTGMTTFARGSEDITKKIIKFFYKIYDELGSKIF